MIDHDPRAPFLRTGVSAALFALGGAAAVAAYAQAAQPGPAQEQLPEIAVVADAQSTPAATTLVLGADELVRRDAIDMSAIARYEPLISVPAAVSGNGSVWDGAGNTGFNVRGVEGNRVSLDLDGIALPDAAPKPDATSMNAFGIGRDYFDPATFREVRIGSGTGGAAAGTQGIGGAVAFSTRAPADYLGQGKDSYASYGFGYSSASRSRAHTLTGAARIGTLEAMALLVHRSGREVENKGDVPANPDDWTSNAVLAKINAPLGGGHAIGVTLDAYRRDNERSFDNKQSALYPEGARQDSHTSRTRISIEHRLKPSVPLWLDYLETRFYVQDSSVEDDTRARYITGGQPYLRNIYTGYLNEATGVASDATVSIGARTTLRYGVALEHNESKRPWREDRTVIATGAHQFMMKNRMADMDTDKASAYVRGEFAFDADRKLVLTPGLRGEYRKLTPKNLENYLVAVPAAARELRPENDSAFTPGVTLSYKLAPAFSVYGQVNRGARLPTAAERTGTYDSFSYSGAGSGYAVLGNPDLDKETSTAVELGVKGAPARGVMFNASLFRTNYDNFIDYVAQAPDPVNYPTITFGLYRPENVGRARTWGGEAALRLELGTWSAPLAGFSLSAAAGVSHGSMTNKLTGAKGGLPSTLPRKATIGAAYDAPQDAWGASLTVVASASRQAPDDVISGVSTPRFAVPGSGVADLSAYWNPGKHARLAIGIYNLGDKKYWDYTTSRSLPAATTASARADIERQARPGRNIAASLTVLY